MTNPTVSSSVEVIYRYRWVILGVLWSTYIVVFLNRLSIGPLGPFFKSDLNLSSAQVGFVVSASAFGYMIPQLPIGWLVDRIGAKWPIVVGELIAGVSMAAVFFSGSYAWMLTLVFLTGFGCGFLSSSTTQAVVVWFPKKERATVMGFKQSAVNVGGILGAATLPTVATAFGWRAGFMFLGAISIGIALVALVLYREPRAGEPAVGQPTVGESSAASLLSPPARVPATPILGILRNRDLWFVALTGFCLNWAEMAFIAHFVIYLNTELLVSVVAAGGLLALAEGTGAFARPGGGLVSDRLFSGRRRPVLALFAAMTSACCLGLAVLRPGQMWALYLIVAIIGIGAIGFGGVLLTLLSELGGRGGAGKAAGLGFMVSMGGTIIGPPTFGHLVDISDSYSLAWISLAIVGALAALPVLFVREPSAMKE